MNHSSQSDRKRLARQLVSQKGKIRRRRNRTLGTIGTARFGPAISEGERMRVGFAQKVIAWEASPTLISRNITLWQLR